MFPLFVFRNGLPAPWNFSNRSFVCFTLMVAVATQRRILLALTAAYLLIMGLAWKFLHERLTSRRTGYAELPGDPAKQLLAVILLAGCLTLAVVAAVTLTSGSLWNLDQWPDWTPLLSGLVLGGGFLHTAWKTGFARYYFFTAVSIGSSVFFWLFPFGPQINPSDRLTLSLFVTATVLIIGGAVSITRFVRTRPILPREVSDGR